MITISSLTLQRGTKVLFDQVSLTIFAKQKVGLVGVNGCGKSSLFALLLDKLHPDSGDVYIQSGITIAHLAQEVPNTDIPTLEYVMQGDAEVADLLQKIKQAETEQDHNAISQLHNRLYEIGGYNLEARAAKVLNGLGFSKSEHHKAVNAFSGGWRMRLNLAQVLLSRADFLLLDEPTNYLDMDAIVWLERWLQNYSGTLLLISHDREFLDHVVEKIAYAHNQTIDLYTGNYSSFEEQRAEKLAQERSLYEKQQAKIEHLTKYVDRFRAKATKARQAQSRLKMLEKMERVTITQLDSPFSFKFAEPQNCSPPLLQFDQVDFSYGDHQVLQQVNFSLNPQDRIGVLGINGAGKSTFMKLLAGNLQPNTGNVFTNKDLKIGYFAQHQVDQLNLQESSIFHLMQLDPKIREQQARTFLGGFGFQGDMAFGKIENFSGGEKARLVLALLIWQKPNLLLLDEPTNHLDLDMREALAFALQDYSGALVLVAHDRYLLKSTVDEFYLVNAQKVAKFNGDLDDYQKWILERRKQDFGDDVVELKSKPNIAAPKNKNTPAETKVLRQLETKLEKLNQEKERLAIQLNDQTIYQPENRQLLEECLQKTALIDSEIKTIEEKWFELHG